MKQNQKSMIEEPDYRKLISDTVEQLPLSRQIEVYHFAQFIKSTAAKKRRQTSSAKRKSVFSLFGKSRSSVTDASINHDKYLYE